MLFNWFRKRKRPDVAIVVFVEKINSSQIGIRVSVDGHESDVAVALLMAMDMKSDFAKAVRQAVTLYLDPSREITKFD